MFTKPGTTNVALGLATKPYPGFRLPGECRSFFISEQQSRTDQTDLALGSCSGWNKFSVGYFSADGFKAHNYPFTAQSYGPAFLQGDVIGVGYRPRTGTVFFTRNGKKLDDAFVGLNRHNLFPTVGADGAAEVHVNLGQAGFVFIEANVKKWGLAPMVGTLAPPPAYGLERGSILIEAGLGTPANNTNTADLPPPPGSPPAPSTSAGAGAGPSTSRRHRARRPDSSADGSSQAWDSRDEHSRRARADSTGSAQDSPHNPPTPNGLDISLHSLAPLDEPTSSSRGGASTSGSARSYFPSGARHHGSPSAMNPSTSRRGGQGSRYRSPSPPPYSPVCPYRYRDGVPDVPGWEVSGALGGTEASNNQPRRASGRTHSIANQLLGMLADRGLLTPLSASDPAGSGSGPGSGSGSGADIERERSAREMLTGAGSGGGGPHAGVGAAGASGVESYERRSSSADSDELETATRLARENAARNRNVGASASAGADGNEAGGNGGNSRTWRLFGGRG